MKYVLLYESAEDFRAKVPQHVEAHRALWKQFRDEGQLLLIGPFTDEPAGAMGVFGTREAAERFAKADPFVAHGVVARWTIREWNEALAP
ncbi:MAG TPA: YciI family protein [Polyangiaceae bacterium]|nr:YciI family protein [Polyangiaceae bacterium]